MQDRRKTPVEPSTRIAAVVGPTGVGKTAVAVEVCRAIGGDVVSADAMQVYRGMDIGTAKPSASERRAVPFHLVDVADVDEAFSVARYKELADLAVSKVAARGRLPVLTGGSGLYYRAVVDDLDFANAGGGGRRRSEVEGEFDEIDDLGLHELLSDLDPGSAAAIPPANRRRVLRALEVARRGNRLMSERQRAWLEYRSPYRLAVAGLEMDRPSLYRRIDERVDRMIEGGLADEVERLRSRGLRRGSTAGEALAYRQLLEHLDGEKTLEDAVEEIKRRTRNYAKRQITWFRSDPRVRWFEVRGGDRVAGRSSGDEIDEAAAAVLEYFRDYLEN